MKTRNKISIVFIALVLLVAFFPARKSIQAQRESAYDLINSVNALRTSKGLDPYQIDSGLMSYAQQHADYMASIQSATHTHSDGSVAWEIGIQENVATGTEGIVNVSIVVYQIWSDWIHWKTMVDYASGDVGAGVALGADGMVYYVLNVRAGTAVPITVPTSGLASVVPITVGSSTITPDLIAILIKSTPAADGSIVHVVDFGQSLWSIAIAYGVKMDDIRQLNNLAMDSTIINVGQKLLISPASKDTLLSEDMVTPTITETVVYTKIPITKSPTTIATNTASIMQTMSPTSTPEVSVEPESNNFFYILITISLIGLLFAIFFGFKKTEPETKIDE
ncbi:MAG: CAP domain-containing protein [Anaerolineaceae bacterium]|nr:CAP domain-containing protein [Anaerolineaceae bacterium]